jgi:hypothetical protein
MPNNSKSPNKFFGNIAGAAAGAARSGAFNAIASRGGIFGKAIQAAQARKAARVAGNIPSVVATAGASGMSGRIESIESRLQALEGGDTSVGAAQPAEVAPAETFTDPLTGMEIQRGATGNEISTEARAEAARAAIESGNNAIAGSEATARMSGILPSLAQPQVAASEELGSLMASPFTMRQRSNMGSLKLKK